MRYRLRGVLHLIANGGAGYARARNTGYGGYRGGLGHQGSLGLRGGGRLGGMLDPLPDTVRAVDQQVVHLFGRRDLRFHQGYVVAQLCLRVRVWVEEEELVRRTGYEYNVSVYVLFKGDYNNRIYDIVYCEAL